MDILALAIGTALGLAIGLAYAFRLKASAAATTASLHQSEGRIAQLEAHNADLAATNRQHSDLDALLKPLNEGLARVSQVASDADRRRAEAESRLITMIEDSRTTNEHLSTGLRQLVAAMAKGQSRGQWGEMQLETLLSHAGLIETVHYSRQDTRDGGAARPDLVVKLPGRGEVLVDAKFPWDAYFEAMGTDDPGVRSSLLDKHARDLAARVAELSRKQYTATSAVTPDFVVLFLPLEPLLSTALDHDGLLLETAFNKNIILATPTTMLGLLRTIAFAWSRHDLAVNAEEIRELSSKMLERIGMVVEHVNRMGTRLRGTVDAYNSLVASVDTRLVQQAQKIASLGVPAAKSLELPAEVANDVRHLTTAAPATDDADGAASRNLAP